MSTENLKTPVEVDPFSIFGTKVEDITSYEETDKRDWSKTYYEPDPENGETTTLIKLCMNIFNPKDSLPKRYTYKLPIPENPDRTWTFLSPSTVGESCPAVTLWFKLKDLAKKGDMIADAKAKNLSRKRNRAVMIQIINDLKNPSLNGQFRILRFPEGMDIDNLIAKKINPSDDEKKLGAEAENVFDPCFSPLMILRCGKGDYGRDFSKSSWAPEKSNHGNLVPKERKENGEIISYRPLTKEDSAKPEELRKNLVWMMDEMKKPEVNLQENWMYAAPDEKIIERLKNSLELIESGTFTPSAPPADGSAKLDKPVATTPSATPAETPAATTPAPTATPAATPDAAPAATSQSSTSGATDEDALMKELGLQG